MKKTFILILLVSALVGLCVACPPQCPPGTVYGQTGQNCYQVPATYGSCNFCPSSQQCTQMEYWESNGFNNRGDCISHYVHSHHQSQNQAELTCKAVVNTDCHTVYNCHTSGYVSCDGANHEKQIITPAHQHCDPIFGCIPTTCPAIPCPDGQDCVDGQCLPRVCPRIPCDTGFHCEENQCDPDICGEDYQCEQGYVCNEALTNCIRKPSMMPYTEFVGGGQCPDPYGGNKIVPINGGNFPRVSLSGWYVSQFDTIEISTLQGEELSDGFYNPVRNCERSYGGMPSVSVPNPMKAILIRAAKESLTDFTLPMKVTVRSGDEVLYEEITTGRVVNTTLLIH